MMAEAGLFLVLTPHFQPHPLPWSSNFHQTPSCCDLNQVEKQGPASQGCYLTETLGLPGFAENFDIAQPKKADTTQWRACVSEKNALAGDKGQALPPLSICVLWDNSLS